MAGRIKKEEKKMKRKKKEKERKEKEKNEKKKKEKMFIIIKILQTVMYASCQSHPNNLFRHRISTC